MRRFKPTVIAMVGVTVFRAMYPEQLSLRTSVPLTEEAANTAYRLSTLRATTQRVVSGDLVSSGVYRFGARATFFPAQFSMMSAISRLFESSIIMCVTPGMPISSNFR